MFLVPHIAEFPEVIFLDSSPPVTGMRGNLKKLSKVIDMEYILKQFEGNGECKTENP